MKKQYFLILILVILLVLSAQLVSAAPPWKKSATTTPTPTGTTTTTKTTTNVPPQITSISLKPDPVGVDGVLKCSVTPYDGNGDQVKVSYKWTTTGSYNLNKSAASTLDLSLIEDEKEGDVITCIATPNDGKVNGISAQESVTISSRNINWEMIGVILVIIGGIVGWLISKKVRGKTAKYMGEIDGVYRSYSKNANKCEAELAGIREKIENDFKKGKINDQSLALLEARIDKYSEKLRGEMIDKGFKLPSDLNKKIKHMLSDGIITKEEHAHFLDALKERSGLSKQDEERLKSLIKKWETEDKR